MEHEPTDGRPAEPPSGPLGALEHRVEQAVEQVVAHVKPRLRGWLHAGVAPLVLAAGIVLVVLAPTPVGRWSAAVFAFTSVLLFTTSAVYHRGTWSPRMYGILKRWDHANIFLIIAGSYTPFALLLPREQSRTLLLIVWFGALGGVLFRVFWVGAPRWLYVPVYVALGFVAIFYLGDLARSGGPVVFTLISAGGLLYTLGAVVYGLRWPDPSPRWFGFHEVFHLLTILAFTAHYIAASLTLYTLVG